MDPLNTAPAAAVEPTATGAAPAAPAAAAPAAPVADAAAPEPAPAHTPVDPIEGATLVPFGTVAKMEELAKTGDAAALEAWIKEQPEELQATLRDAFDGKATIQDNDPAPAPVDADTFEPFTAEELAQLDPALAARVSFAQEQLAEKLDALEAAKNHLPDQMKRLIQDPYVAARLEEMASGKSYVPPELNTEAILEFAAGALESSDAQSLAAMLEQVVKAIPDLMLGVRGQATQEYQAQAEAVRQENEFNTFMYRGLTSVGTKIPEFQSSLPDVVLNEQGETVPNPQHPAGAFTYWLADMMKKGAITHATLDEIGFEQVAYTYLSQRKGGMGQVVQGAVQSAEEKLRNKLAKSRNQSLASAQAKTLNVPTAGVIRPLMHGVDLELAARDTAYSAREYAKLTDTQKREVKNALLRRAGLVA